MSRAIFILTAALALVATSSPAFAQATAQIRGTVRDEGGGALPGADVTVEQTETGATRATVTDGSGSYVLVNLPLGPYQLRMSLSGFRTFEQTGIVLQVGSSPTIDVTLPLGTLAETVSVEAAAPLVDTQRAGIGEVIESTRIVELPLNGRNPVDLVLLVGAAVQTGTASTRGFVGSSGGVAISVAGGQSTGTAYVLDGAMHNSPYDNLNLPLPFPDALQEFRVETGALGAGSGVHSGASVNAVTKSGTNVLHGGAFEFWRNHRFNATHPFATIGPDGKRQGDGLNRNQFGGTVGGPLRQDRMFFFGGYQGTFIRQTPTSNVSFVPTPAMLAGDFTAAASAACNSGRAVTLRGPFVNNRVNPALFSGAAVELARRLPTSSDPCGELVWGFRDATDEGQYIGRLDLQSSVSSSLFGRYVLSTFHRTPPLANTDNLLASIPGGAHNKAHSVTLGHTWVLNSSAVNALRFTRNYTDILRLYQGYFSGPDLGINMYSYQDDYFIMSVTGAFTVGSGVQNYTSAITGTWQAADDLTIVRGGHQLAIGGNVARWDIAHNAHVRSPGNFTINGQVTGLPLADFLVGNVSQFIQAAPNQMMMEQWYLGFYGADTWRVSPRLTLNYGARWEPFFPMQLVNGYVYNFSLERFRQGLKSSVYRNAPAGFSYPGDDAFVGGRSGMRKHWDNVAPRISAAWDATNDGRTSVRVGYGLGYGFVNGQYHLNTSVAPPWGADVRIQATSLDDPYGTFPGGNPFPRTFDANAEFPPSGQFLALDPDGKGMRTHSWNVVLERQIGSNMAVSASYIGNRTNNLWNMKALNPGLFLGLGPCVLQGQLQSVCSTQANLDRRRVLMFENPAEARFLAGLDQHDTSGRQAYNGLILSFQRRSTSGVSATANYTLSKCEGHPTTTLPNIGTGWADPNNPDYDYGPCDSDRRHLFNATLGIRTPQFNTGGLDAVLGNWNVSGIFRTLSGPPLTVITGQDRAMTGIVSNQRADLVGGGDGYGAKTVASWLDRAAFSQPALGSLGNSPRGGWRGPSNWWVDLVLARTLRLTTAHQLDLRVEVFNVLNNMRLNTPVTNLSNATFGRILGADAPRIMQFAVKYAF